MKKILVTGANGFIGQHLCKKLIADGNLVTGLFHEKLPIYQSGLEKVKWVNGSVDESKTLADAFNEIEIVYHLAAIPRNDLSKSWSDFERVNIFGTRNLLELSKKFGIKKFIMISTVESAGYGDGINPRKESDPVNPDNNYGKSKQLAEQLVLNGTWNFAVTIVRLPMIYGPGSFLTVPKIFGWVKKGIYPLIGSGNTLMEFCYVQNAVDAIIVAGESDKSNGEIFYTSDERSYSIKEVMTKISEIMGKKIHFIHIPVFIAYAIAFIWEITAKILPFYPIISPVSKKPFFTRETVWWTTRNVNIVSTEKISSFLGYKPKYSIDDGCKDTIKWLNETIWKL